MTTTVKVHVNGRYRATVVQDDLPPVIVEGNYNGGSGEHYIHLGHPATGTFTITEEAVPEEPAAAAEAPPADQPDPPVAKDAGEATA